MLLTTDIDTTTKGLFEGLGGGVYNRGEIVVDGESLFMLNVASVSCANHVLTLDSMIFAACSECCDLMSVSQLMHALKASERPRR